MTTPVYGPTNPTEQQKVANPVKCYAEAIELRPEMEEEYRRLHANVWPEVVAAIKKANIRNFKIFLTEIEGKKYLIKFFEYTGDHAQKDFASIAEDPTTRAKWWPLTDVCQKRLAGTPEGEQWKPIEMIMHLP